MEKVKQHRTRGKCKDSYTPLINANMYRKFVKTHPQWAEFHKGMSNHTEILEEFHKEFMQEVTVNRYGADLPLAMGNISLVSYKLMKRIPDFYRPPAERATAPPLVNAHTDGLQCKIQYSVYLRRYKLQDKFMWEFQVYSPHRKTVSRAFRENPRFYVQRHNGSQVRTRMTIQNMRRIEEEQLIDFMEDYNEFDI